MCPDEPVMPDWVCGGADTMRCEAESVRRNNSGSDPSSQ